MKWKILLIITLMLFSFGCTELQNEEEVTTPTEGYELEEYVIGEDRDIGNEVFYSIRLTNFGPDPDYIEANKGDILTLEIVNDIQLDQEFELENYDYHGIDYEDNVDDIEEEEYSTAGPAKRDGSDIDELERSNWFVIYGYGIEERLERLGVADITITLNNVGTFEFGDDTTNIPKGTLVVN